MALMRASSEMADWGATEAFGSAVLAEFWAKDERLQRQTKATAIRLIACMGSPVL
jgi:hypothetical protein